MDPFLNVNKDNPDDCLSTLNSCTTTTPLLSSKKIGENHNTKFQRRCPDLAPQGKKSLLLSGDTNKNLASARSSLEFFESEIIKINNTKPISIFYHDELISSLPMRHDMDVNSENTFLEAIVLFLKTVGAKGQPSSGLFQNLGPEDLHVLIAKKDGSIKRDYPDVDMSQKVGRLIYNTFFIEINSSLEILDRKKKEIFDCDTKIIEYEEKMERSSSSTLIAEKLYGNSLRKMLSEDKKGSILSDNIKGSVLGESLKRKKTLNSTLQGSMTKSNKSCLFCYYPD